MLANVNLRSWTKKFPHVVKINDNPDLTQTYKVIAWLCENYPNGLGKKYDVDMLGGQEGYSLFFFKNLNDALLCKLTNGGAM